MLNEKTLSKITRVPQNHPVTQAQLFGSQMRDDATPHNDIDLHIQLDKDLLGDIIDH